MPECNNGNDGICYVCPHCEKHITQTNFSEGCTQYGSYDIASEDYDYRDSDNCGDCNHTCPECDHDINIDDLEKIDHDKDNEDNEEKPKELIELIEPIYKKSMIIETIYTEYNQTLKKGKECPKCKTFYSLEYDDEITCQKCNLVLTK